MARSRAGRGIGAVRPRRPRSASEAHRLLHAAGGRPVRQATRHEGPGRWALASALALGFAFASPGRSSSHEPASWRLPLPHAIPGVRAGTLRLGPDSPDSRIARASAPLPADGIPAPLARPCSGTPGSNAIQGGRNDSRERRRQPDSRVAVEISRRGHLVRRGSLVGCGALRLTPGDAVFHEAHAPPARSGFLVSRPS
jgi:hypothetical protein